MGLIVDHLDHKNKDDYEYLQIAPCDCGCQDGIIVPALKHTFNIFVFILLTNIIFTIIITFIGEENLSVLLKTNILFQPIIAGLIGFIPNCAGSVVLTQLYVSGGLSFGALFTGLTTSAGVGTLALLKSVSYTHLGQEHNVMVVFGLGTKQVVTGNIFVSIFLHILVNH